MSRSKRKPYWTDNHASYMKRVHSKRVRANVRELLSHWLKDPENWDVNPIIPNPFSITNQYDLCDFSFYSPKDPRAYRK